MPDLSTELKGTLPNFPTGYDVNGRSVFYNESFVSRSRQSRRLFRTRPLRFGSPTELELVDVSSEWYPDIPSPHYALKEYIRTFLGESKTPVYIFDDHNHAFFAWSEALAEEKIEKGAKLFHFDDHLDGKKRAQGQIPVGNDLKGLASLAQSVDYDVFIELAIRNGLVKDVYWIQKYFKKPEFHPEDQNQVAYTTLGSSFVSEQFGPDTKKSIVDIDLDYFSYIENPEQIEQEIQRIKEAMKKAGVITMAISPGFIDENRAIELVCRLLI